MREIKFRAWDTDEGMMRNQIAVDESGVADAPWGKAKPHWILMQYTGLKDKNGKEIYEGDLLKHKTAILEVVWGEEKCADCVRFQINGHKYFKSLAWLKGKRDIEIIGNIYESLK